MAVHRIAERVMDAEERFEGFENLMPFKVHNILLVSSLLSNVNTSILSAGIFRQ
jgi:hypothetical protein